VAAEGQRVTILVHPTIPSPIGGVTIREGGAIVAQGTPDPFTWTTPPLSAGRHVYTITYKDQYAAASDVTVTVEVMKAPSRRRPSLPH
jgi:hypothetical protein